MASTGTDPEGPRSCSGRTETHASAPPPNRGGEPIARPPPPSLAILAVYRCRRPGVVACSQHNRRRFDQSTPRRRPFALGRFRPFAVTAEFSTKQPAVLPRPPGFGQKRTRNRRAWEPRVMATAGQPAKDVTPEPGIGETVDALAAAFRAHGDETIAEKLNSGVLRASIGGQLTMGMRVVLGTSDRRKKQGNVNLLMRLERYLFGGVRIVQVPANVTAN